MAEETGVGILLVEDNDIDRDIYTRVLKRAGFRVVAASSYEEATAALDRDDALALMVTDVRLPAVHGFMLARMAVARRPGIKILYVTGLTELPMHEKGLALGRVLQKSSDPELLVSQVREVLAE